MRRWIVADRGSLITAGPGVVIRLCCIWQASQQVSASSRIISARCVTPVSCQSLISRLKVTMRQVWTVGSAGAGGLSPGTDACGIAGGASVIAVLKKTVPGGELIERGSERSAGDPGRWRSPLLCHRPGADCRDPAVIVRFRSRGSAVKTRRSATGASQFGVDLARQGIQGRVGTPDPSAAQGPP